MRVVVAGGSGALGRRLCDRLDEHGHDVIVLSRSANSAQHRTVVWDGKSVGTWANELDGAAVVNLAGALVDRRPTPANVRLLMTSRVEPTTALVQASEGRDVSVWLQASTLAIYGDAGKQVLTEQSPPANGPPQMAGVARAWERAAQPAAAQRQLSGKSCCGPASSWTATPPPSTASPASFAGDWVVASPAVVSGSVGSTSRTGRIAIRSRPRDQPGACA